MPSQSSSNKTSSHDQSKENIARGSVNTNERIIGFTSRLKLPDSAFVKRRRNKESTEPAPVRVKSESELREEAAWKQVEETGKPVVLDGRLLVPDGMHVREAMEDLPDGIREQAIEDLDQKLAGVFKILLNGAERQIREDAEKRGELAEYETLPQIGRQALAEMVVRKQMNMPEVPIEEIIDRLQKQSEINPEPKKQSKPTKVRRKPQPETDNRREPQPIVIPETDLRIKAVPQSVFEHQESIRISRVSQWNLEHHGLLLKRLDQVWKHLTAEEQKTVLGYLGKEMSKTEIDAIEVIIKGCEWVQRVNGYDKNLS